MLMTRFVSEVRMGNLLIDCHEAFKQAATPAADGVSARGPAGSMSNCTQACARSSVTA